MTKDRVTMMFRADVPPEIESDWNNWHNKHLTDRINIPDIISGRRFRSIHDEPKYMVIYDYTSVDVLTSEAYLQLRDKEGTLPQDTFEAITMQQKLPNSCRSLYKQIYPYKGEYRVSNTEYILAIGHDVPSTKEDEFNAWYNTERIPAMNLVPGVVTARRLLSVDMQFPERSGAQFWGPKYVALYDLESEDVFHSDAFIRAQESPWTSLVNGWCKCSFYLEARLVYPKSQKG
jgi:hypothetical protein